METRSRSTESKLIDNTKKTETKKKRNQIIKINHYTRIWSIVKEVLRKNISTFKKIRYFSCGEYLVTRCSYQGAHVCVCKKYIKIVDKYIKILLINIK